ncbi:hypothetical protein ACTL6P_17060 [Endozoicomonas acroporae]|uniref:hypothetical protein n=1 Tax=Endozoicomonas acroporae TaxID=1701104 RepID=UPI0011AF230A|nr:hypothetical protein [Endozoicomonas acroporae]
MQTLPWSVISSVNNAHVVALGDCAGIAGGDVWGMVLNTTAVNCTVATSADGKYAGAAGIGAGFLRGGGMVVDTTAVNCSLASSTNSGAAGIGAGKLIAGAGGRRGMVANTTAVNCKVENSAQYGGAGIGVGTAFNDGTIAHTTAVDCIVENTGQDGDAGIGLGKAVFFDMVANTTAINCEVDSEYGDAGVMGGPEAGICNVRVNGDWQNNTNLGCHPWLDNSVAGIDPGLLPPNYRPDVYNFTALANNQIQRCGFFPTAMPATIPTTIRTTPPHHFG